MSADQKDANGCNGGEGMCPRKILRIFVNLGGP